MSSHHIVKEKQEPALYIHQLGNFNEELLGQLLEWSPTIIVNEADYEKLVSLGIKVDLIAGNNAAADSQEHTAYIWQTSGKIDGVIDYLLKKGYPALNIIAEGRGKEALEQYARQLNIVWLNEREKTFSINSGFNVWKPSGIIFSFDEGNEITTTNLHQLDNGSYEVITDGFVSFTFKRERLFITEQL